jgi:DNA-binding transcriptional regulator YiaG
MTKGKPRIEWNADTIKALRQHMGLTQQEMSEELGTRQQTISEWETGMYKPRGATRTLLNIIAERAGFVYRVEEDEGKGNSREAGDSN